MDHEEIKQLLPLAALDRLEHDEAEILDEHLRSSCDECTGELQEYRAAAAAIPLADEPAVLHDRIWARLEARLAAEGDRATAADISQRPATVASGRAGRPAPRSEWRIATGLAAAAAIVAVIYANMLRNQLHQQGNDVRAQVASLKAEIADLRSDVSEARVRMATLQQILANRERLQRVLLTPDVTLTRLAPLPAAPNANAIVAFSRSNDAAAIEARGLPPSPPGKIYELWWITKESGPIPAGLFAATGNGAVTAGVSLPPAGQHVLLSAVTLEPIPGVPKPTGAMYLKGAPG